jgi:hypothetical protein
MTFRKELKAKYGDKILEAQTSFCKRTRKVLPTAATNMSLVKVVEGTLCVAIPHSTLPRLPLGMAQHNDQTLEYRSKHYATVS